MLRSKARLTSVQKIIAVKIFIQLIIDNSFKDFCDNWNYRYRSVITPGYS
jgi:hypothetical protein